MALEASSAGAACAGASFSTAAVAGTLAAGAGEACADLAGCACEAGWECVMAGELVALARAPPAVRLD